MKRFILAVGLLAVVTGSARAWNEKGHMVVARIAWKQMDAADRAKIIAILRDHPHFDEFLKARRPNNIPEDEWVFMRAATWSDWVRGGPPARRAFNKPTHHYVNLPFKRPDSTVNPPDTPNGELLVKLPQYIQEAKAGGDREKRSVAAAWVFHLIGDIHQPLHCAALFSDEFPEGDRGGNRSLARLDSRRIQLHSFWDGLLGTSTTLSSIGGTVQEIEALVQANPDSITAEMTDHVTIESWANEGLENAKRHAYGKPDHPDFWPANADDDPGLNMIPRAPDDYAEEAAEVARFCAAKAGRRLAKVLKEIAAAN